LQGMVIDNEKMDWFEPMNELVTYYSVYFYGLIPN